MNFKSQYNDMITGSHIVMIFFVLETVMRWIPVTFVHAGH